MIKYQSRLAKAGDASGCGAVGSALPWGGRGRWFKSSHSDQISTMVLILNHRAVSFPKKPCGTMLFDTLAQQISFTVSKLTAQELKLEYLNLHVFQVLKTTMKLLFWISFIVIE